MRKITLDQLEDRVITIDRGLSQRINSVEQTASINREVLTKSIKQLEALNEVVGDFLEESKDRFAVVGEFMEEFKRRQK
jgi:hypothetical protein